MLTWVGAGERMALGAWRGRVSGKGWVPGRPGAARRRAEARAQGDGRREQPSLRGRRKLGQGSAYLHTDRRTHTLTHKGVTQTRHHGGRTSVHAHTRLDRRAAGSASTGSPLPPKFL